MPIDPERQMAAVLGALGDVMKPVLKQQIREVLERNESIVDQHEQALEHLADEIASSLFRPLQEL